MISGFIRHLRVTTVAVALIGAGLAPLGDIATADPNQDQKFFDLLGEKDIPPVDGENGLVTTAHKVCSKLDEGMSVGDMVELIRNNGFNENPLTRLQPQGRVTRTIDRFITAAVEAYCPYDKGKVASIAAYQPRPDASERITLVSFVGPLPVGEIAPTKPLPVPAQTPLPLPEIQPAPQQPPPPPRHPPPVPKQAPPPPEEPPPPPEAPQAPPPEAPPAPAAPGGGGGNAPVPDAPPGGGAGGGSVPASPTPDQPAPPGHVRLAP